MIKFNRNVLVLQQIFEKRYIYFVFIFFPVLWLDCDKEGENICFEVMNCVLHVMKPRRNEQTVFRAKFCKSEQTYSHVVQNLRIFLLFILF